MQLFWLLTCFQSLLGGKLIEFIGQIQFHLHFCTQLPHIFLIAPISTNPKIVLLLINPNKSIYQILLNLRCKFLYTIANFQRNHTFFDNSLFLQGTITVDLRQPLSYSLSQSHLCRLHQSATFLACPYNQLIFINTKIFISWNWILTQLKKIIKISIFQWVTLTSNTNDASIFSRIQWATKLNIDARSLISNSPKLNSLLLSRNDSNQFLLTYPLTPNLRDHSSLK